MVSHLPFESSDLLSLPIQPTVAGKLLAALDDETTTLSKLTQIAGYDPVISARMLAVANSTAFKNRAPCLPNLASTFAVLGQKTIKAIAIATVIHQECRHPHSIPITILDSYWWHTLTCAHLARRLANMIGYPEPEEAYLGGLLHDLGKLIIGIRHPEALASLDKARALTTLAQTLNEGQTSAMLDHALSQVPARERPLFGTDHCESGAALVEMWRLNSFIADAVRFHHLRTEELRGAHPLLRLIHAANTLSQEDNELGNITATSAHILLGVPPESLRKARAETEREIAQLAEDFGIAVPTHDSDRRVEPSPTTTSPAQLIGEPSHKTSEKVNGSKIDPTRPVATTIKTNIERTIHELAIVNEARSELCGADDEPALLDAIVRCTSVLFDFNQAQVFLRESETGMLRARANQDMLSKIVIDPDGATNVAARAFQEWRVHHSLDEGVVNTGIVDRQLSQLWRTDGVLCLPLHIPNQSPFGVLAIGISRANLLRSPTQMRLLESFAAVAASELDQSRRREAQRVRFWEDHELIERQRLRIALHEISNPLTIVHNYLYLLPIKLGENTAREELRILREETERISRILGQLTETDGGSVKDSGVDLNQTIRDFAPALDDTLCRPRGVRLNLNLAKILSPLARGCDAIRQILLNLVRNAVEALGSGGTITVATQDLINWHGRQYVEITVADDGPGLSDVSRAKLFQPVASTKGSGHAGLGLSIVKSLTEELGGYIGNRPHPNGGTIFMVLLPKT